MDKKVILIYDRIENGQFVPNGWSKDCEYFIDSNKAGDINKYIQTYKVEPIVHFQLELDVSNSNNTIIPKLADEVDENFIYPVEQFGAVEKLIGEEVGYEKYCFLNHIRKSTLQKIKDKKGKIVIFAVEESRVTVNNLVFLHEQLEKSVIPSLRKGQPVVGKLKKEKAMGKDGKKQEGEEGKGDGSESQKQEWHFHKLLPSEIHSKPER